MMCSAFNNDSTISFNITVCCTLRNVIFYQVVYISLSSPTGGK